MPRCARLDAPAAIHHVMLRGIEQRPIFRDDQDRADFAERLDRLVPELGFRCFAWVLMPNHVHLALQTGLVGLSRLMARLGTGYARTFNLRHQRAGHLMQNRFKSRLVGDESDLVGLVIYIHANPLRAGLVSGGRDLEEFAWCGHGSLLGRRPARPFESSGLTLALFSDDAKLARERIRRRIETTQKGDPFPPDVVRAEGQECEQASSCLVPEERAKETTTDERRSLDGLIAEVCQRLGAEEVAVRTGRRGRLASAARAEIAYQAIHGLGVRASRVGEALGVSESGISRAIDRVWRARLSQQSG